MDAVVADSTEGLDVMKRTQREEVWPPGAHVARKHRVADAIPTVNQSTREVSPAECRRGGVETLMELCRSLDRLLWKSFTATQREETRDE